MTQNAASACLSASVCRLQGLEEERAVMRTGAQLNLRGDRVVLPPARRAKDE